LNTKGFTLIEMVIVVVLFGVISSLAIPKLRMSPQAKLRGEARVLVRSLEAARSLAMSRKKEVRVTFGSDGRVSTFLSDSLVSVMSLGNGAEFASDGVSPLPGYPAGGPVTFEGSEVKFDARGLPVPRGTRGVVYLGNGGANSAVTVAGSGSFKAWTFTGEGWR